MATPNYSYEKRQRELAKKRKADEKRQRKNNKGPDDGAPEPSTGSDSTTSRPPGPAIPPAP